MNKIAIFGYSGFASEVVDICDALNIGEIVYLSEGEPTVKDINGITVVNEVNVFKLAENGFKFAIGVAEPRIRKKIYQRYAQLEFVNLVHPSVTFGRRQRERISDARGLIIGAGARLMSCITVGDFVVVSVNATIGHDCILGSYASIMPGANISGNVTMGEEVFVGSGAVILQGSDQEKLYLAKSLVIGAGAVVTKSFFEASVLIGAPARKIKEAVNEKK